MMHAGTRQEHVSKLYNRRLGELQCPIQIGEGRGWLGREAREGSRWGRLDLGSTDWERCLARDLRTKRHPNQEYDLQSAFASLDKGFDRDLDAW
jgi:hypothetical protein